MRVVVVIIAWLASTAFLASGTGAQEANDDLSPLEILNVETLQDGRVAVEVAAPAELTDTDLPATAFRIAQDGVDRPLSSQRLPDDALDVVLVIDISGSMTGSPMDDAKAAAEAFLRQAPKAAQVALVSFGATANVESSLTNDFQSVADAIAALEPDGETALFDGVALAVEQFPLARTSRRTIVVLSDGSDTVSSTGLSDLRARLGETNIDLYAVALGDVDVDPLRGLVATADGGRLIEATASDELLSVFDDIAAVLASQYRLLFTPADSVGASGRVFVDQLGVAAVGDFTFEATSSAPPRNDLTTDASAQSTGEIAPQPSFATIEASWAASDSARLVGLGTLGAAMFLAGLLLFSSGTSAVRLASNVRSMGSPQSGVEKAAFGAEQVAERLLAKRDRGRMVGAALERAGSSMRPAEFIVVVGAIAVAAWAIVLLFVGPLAGIVAAVLIVISARSWLSYRGAQRSEAFTEQLGSTVQLLAGALRAGYALPGAFEAVSKETESPTSDEFHRLVTELRLGRSVDQSLEAMDQRVNSEDFRWVVRAIDIHRQVGGDLAEVLDNINGTIRDRGYIRRQFSALSAEGRYSAYLLVALPFIVIAALLVTSPDYLDLLFRDTRGRVLLFSAFTSLTIGAMWLRTMLKVRF